MTSITNSTQAFYGRSQLHIGTLRAEAEGLQNQLATGERLSRSSDDPVAASRLRMLSRQEQLGAIDAGNARQASEDLQLTGSALEAIADDLIRARELALYAANGTTGETERSAIAAELEELRLRILSNANGIDSGGNALLGGEGSGRAYEVAASGAIVYVGTASSGTIDLGGGQSITRGLTGPEVLDYDAGAGPTDIFAEIATLAAALRATGGDPAGAARDALTGFDEALDTVTRNQTVTGSRIAWLDIVQDRQIDQSLTRSRQIADTGGVDFASAVAELQQVLTVLEASQASFARLSNLSLFNQI